MYKAIYLDMDGTIADLYSVDNWLGKLCSEDASPYLDAQPMFEAKRLNDIIEGLARIGVEVGVISWASKNSSKAYEDAVREAKTQWLAEHIPAIRNISVVAYGTDKFSVAAYDEDICLIDDDMIVRKSWEANGCDAFYPSNVCEILEEIFFNSIF